MILALGITFFIMKNNYNMSFYESCSSYFCKISSDSGTLGKLDFDNTSVNLKNTPLVINNDITQTSFQNKFFKSLFTNNLMMSNETLPVQRVQMEEVANYYTNVVEAQDVCVIEKRMPFKANINGMIKRYYWMTPGSFVDVVIFPAYGK